MFLFFYLLKDSVASVICLVLYSIDHNRSKQVPKTNPKSSISREGRSTYANCWSLLLFGVQRGQHLLSTWMVFLYDANFGSKDQMSGLARVCETCTLDISTLTLKSAVLDLCKTNLRLIFRRLYIINKPRLTLPLFKKNSFWICAIKIIITPTSQGILNAFALRHTFYSHPSI